MPSGQMCAIIKISALYFFYFLFIRQWWNSYFQKYESTTKQCQSQRVEIITQVWWSVMFSPQSC